MEIAASVIVGDLESSRKAWEQALSLSSTDTVFLTPWWQEIWWRRFGGNAQPYVLTIREGGALLGVAPMLRAGHDLFLMGEPDLFDYQDVLPVRGREEPFYRALWEFLCKQEWATLSLRSVQQASETLRYLPALCKTAGCSVQTEVDGTVPAASLPATWDAYVEGLEKKERHELRRKLRRLEAAGDVRQRTYADPQELLNCMEDFFRLMRLSREDKERFLTPERERFFVDLAAGLAARGQYRLSFLELSGTRVAGCITFDYGDAYLLYNSGYDPAYASLSVGLLNKALCIKEAIEAGKHTFDFLKGPERYKYDLGGKERLVYRMTVRR
ncbi:MAG: GNAT family N-acetyltransferase [SAR202 cluster bacterium]|nr:GNAT family N-acetyltransferase [SAR202 cluster bacterium]